MFHRVTLSVPSASRQGGGPGAWVQSKREGFVTLHGGFAATDNILRGSASIAMRSLSNSRFATRRQIQIPVQIIGQLE